jgi:hypothetical protein
LIRWQQVCRNRQPFVQHGRIAKKWKKRGKAGKKQESTVKSGEKWLFPTFWKTLFLLPARYRPYREGMG